MVGHFHLEKTAGAHDVGLEISGALMALRSNEDGSEQKFVLLSGISDLRLGDNVRVGAWRTSTFGDDYYWTTTPITALVDREWVFDADSRCDEIYKVTFFTKNSTYVITDLGLRSELANP